MAVEVMKLNSGYDMPAVGLGTWQVCVRIYHYLRQRGYVMRGVCLFVGNSAV